MSKHLRNSLQCQRLLCSGSPHSSRTPRFSPIPSVPIRVQRRYENTSAKGLTESRIKTPWIEALRKQQRDELEPPKSPGPRDMTPKQMRDSYHQVELPLAREPWLSDTYLNASGRIRLGTLFMDLDALAGIIAYKHTGECVTVVTAAVDRITIKEPPTELSDLSYSGQVTYATGRSSMEITCRVSKARDDGESPKDDDIFLTVLFTFVALDPVTKKSVNIPPLLTTTASEKHLFELGESRSKHKKSLAAATLLHSPPNLTESALIHNIWLRSRAYHDPSDPSRRPNNVHAMSSTQLSNTSIMQPQFRNRHQFQVFGGFLMRHAYELAFSCCASFAHARPTFVSLDPSKFMNPVPVGSVLYLTAVVAYTDPPMVSEADVAGTQDGEGTHGQGEQQGEAQPTEAGTQSRPKQTRVQVRVDSKVRSVEHGTSKPTGQFNYTFTVGADVKVMPQTYQEFMVYIDARRRVIEVDEQARKEAEAKGAALEDGNAVHGAHGVKAGAGAAAGERITE